jgi:hypothetical protein
LYTFSSGRKSGKGYRMTEISKTTPTEDESETGRGTFLKEVRCAVRFPLSLPVELSEDQPQDSPAITRNVSANGVLLELSGPLNVGDELDFNLRMPGSVLGTPQDVLVHCRGRVVRCSISQSHYQAAATIDEYHFVEQ